MLTLGIAVKLFHKVFSVCFERQKVTKGCLSRHHFLLEALYIMISFALPCTVIWFSCIVTGPGGYDTWCWMEAFCHDSKKDFLEQLLPLYIPYVTVFLLSLLCIAAIVGFLIYVCVRHYKRNRKKVMVAMHYGYFLFGHFLLYMWSRGTHCGATSH